MKTLVPELLNIPPAGALDRIHVYWMNEGPGQGYVTITCWGAAWTAYFGGMGEKTIQEFFAMADVSYLTNKMGITRYLKQTKQHEQYLGRIIEAVKVALAEGASK